MSTLLFIIVVTVVNMYLLVFRVHVRAGKSSIDVDIVLDRFSLKGIHVCVPYRTNGTIFHDICQLLCTSTWHINEIKPTSLFDSLAIRLFFDRIDTSI